MGGGTVFICSSKQLKDKVCIYMLFFNKKEVFPQWVCPSLYVQRQVGGGNKRRIFVKRVCKHVISCSAPTVLQISSCFSAALLPAYNILMHLFCLQNSLFDESYAEEWSYVFVLWKVLGSDLLPAHSLRCQKGSCVDAYEKERMCVMLSAFYSVGSVALLLAPCVPRSQLWGLVAQSHNRLKFVF